MKPWLLGVLWGAALVLAPIAVSAQETLGTGQTSLLEQVYQSRITLMEDSLFIIRERHQAAEFMTQNLTRQLGASRDTLAQSRAETRQWADSVASLIILNDQLKSESSQHLARVSTLSDSLARSYLREQALQALTDSLLVLFGQTQEFLITASQSEEAVSDSLAQLRNTLQRLQSQMTSNEQLMNTQLQSLQSTMLSEEGLALDSLLETRSLSYLESIMAYQISRRGLARFMRRAVDPLAGFKEAELALFLAQTRQKGRAGQVQAMLADQFVANGDPVRGALAYLKVLFLHMGSPDWTGARTKIVGLIDRDSEEGRLLYEIALNPDSMRVGNDPFFRNLHYLDHLRSLTSETGITWFLAECRNFLGLYPGVVQTDMLLFWMAQGYRSLGAFHEAILSYNKLQILYPHSGYLPETLLALAEISDEQLNNPAEGVRLYGSFLDGFPNHREAPKALLAMAILLEMQLRDYHQAGNSYRRLADEYPEAPVAPLGLFRYAALLEGRLGSPAAALEVYEEILQGHGDDQDHGIPALNHLADLKLQIDQFDAAVLNYLEIPRRYPEAEEQGVEAILKAAGVYQSKLKDLDAAIHTLHMILDNYPDYPGLRGVQRQVQKLQKKLG